MANFDKFKSFKATPNEKEPFVSKNPYVQKAIEAAKNKSNAPEDPQGTNLLKDSNSMITRVNELQKEVKDLKMDIAAILLLIQGDVESKFTSTQARTIYYDFRGDPSHILNRITDKLNIKTGEIL